MAAPSEITIPRPDDWHLHLRDGGILAAVLPESRHFARVLVMPNLVPPVATAEDVRAYAGRIAALGIAVEPRMTLYLTEATTPAMIDAAAPLITAVKLYPAGATTNSHAGVRNIDAVRPALERMAETGLPLCVHGEVVDADVDIFDREAVFLDRVLDPLRRAVPGLRVVLEHVTTADGVAYVQGADGMGATLTVHHLLLNRNDLLVGGVRPHYYCLPVLKRERHRQALVAAAVSGDGRFFLGTDSAPHPDPAKECACGCAGVFSAPVALPWTAQVFEEAGALDRLAGFVSRHGAAFYGLPVNPGTLTLRRTETPVPPPAKIETPGGALTVFDPARPLHWRVA